MKKELLLLAMSCLLISCGKFLAGITGNYKKPQAESPESIIRYLESQRAQYHSAFVINNMAGLKFFLDSAGNKIPMLFVFNKQKENLITDSRCTWSGINTLDSLNDAGTWKLGKKISYSSVIKNLVKIGGADLNTDNTGEYDYYVFYTYAKYAPKLSSEIIYKTTNLLLSSKGRIYTGAINLDLQESWSN